MSIDYIWPSGLKIGALIIYDQEIWREEHHVYYKASKRQIFWLSIWLNDSTIKAWEKARKGKG